MPRFKAAVIEQADDYTNEKMMIVHRIESFMEITQEFLSLQYSGG
jgi:hypothetical protein